MRFRLALIALLLLSSIAAAREDGDLRREDRELRQTAQVQRDAMARAHQALEKSRQAMVELQGKFVRRGPSGSVRTDTIVAVPARARLELENFQGEILVSGWDRGELRLQATHDDDVDVQVDVGPAVVTVSSVGHIRLPAANRRHGHAEDAGPRIEDLDVPRTVNYRLLVPRRMATRLSGVNTRIRVEGLDGDIEASSVNGPVDVSGGGGTVRVESVNSPVTVVGARGTVEASSIQSVLTLRDLTGTVRAETVDGNVDMARILSAMVEVSTVSGNLRYDGVLRPGGSYRLESHDGDITVVLPERADATVRVETYQGSFRSDFPAPTQKLRRERELEFRLGGGRAALELSSFSGAIQVLRSVRLQAPAAPTAPTAPAARKAAPARPR